MLFQIVFKNYEFCLYQKGTSSTKLLMLLHSLSVNQLYFQSSLFRWSSFVKEIAKLERGSIVKFLTQISILYFCFQNGSKILTKNYLRIKHRHQHRGKANFLLILRFRRNQPELYFLGPRDYASYDIKFRITSFNPFMPEAVIIKTPVH